MGDRVRGPGRGSAVIRELRAGVPNLFGAAQLYAAPAGAGSVELTEARYGIAHTPERHTSGDRVLVDDEPWTLTHVIDPAPNPEHPAAYPVVAMLEHQEEAP